MATPANVVPFGPEAQVMEAVALTLSAALQSTRKPSRESVLEGRARFETAGRLLDVLIRHQETLGGQPVRPVAISPRAQEALLGVVESLGNRALVSIQQGQSRMDLQELFALRLELRECESALSLVVPTFPAPAAESAR